MPGTLIWFSWNLLLAVIPVALGFLLRRLWGDGSRRARLLCWLCGFLWLIFLPNACYLLTEWRHFFSMLERNDLYTRWLVLKDIGALRRLIGSFLFYLFDSGLGMLAFALAIRPVYGLVRGARHAWLWGIPFFPLMSLGVYLGLIERFNTWNLLHAPDTVIAEGWRAVNRPELFGYILAFGAFLWLAYFLLDMWFDGVLLRWRRETTDFAD